MDDRVRGCTGEETLSRRAAVARLGALALSVPLADSLLWQHEQVARDRIDLHHHFFPPSVLERLSAVPMVRDHSPQRSLEEMDAAGVQTAYLSLPLRLGDDPVSMRAESIRVARDANEYGASLVSDNGSRFGLFAYLPMPDVEASLQEIEYALDTLHADGVGLLTSYAGHWLGDPAFQPVFDELNRRAAVVYTHPTDGPCCHNLLPNTMPQTVEWNTDTSRAIWSLINDGQDNPPTTTPMRSMATRYGDVQFVWSHAGGSLLGLIGRFLGRSSLTQHVELPARPMADSKLYHLRRFYYDTAGSANPIQMEALRSLVGTSQIVFGSDYPFVPLVETVEALQQAGFSAEELRAVDRGNARRLFGV